MVRTAILLLLWLFLLCPTPLFAASDSRPEVAVQITAAISADETTVFGTAVYSWEHSGASPQRTVPLWLYPNRFLEPSSRLDEGMLKWIYPRDSGKSGSMQIHGIRWQGEPLVEDAIAFKPLDTGDGTLLPDVIAEISLPRPLMPGENARLTVSFKVTVPVRRGRFGRYDGVMSLAGGWYPVLFSGLSAGEIARPWAVDSVSAAVRLPPGRGAVLNNRIFPVTEEAQQISVRNARVSELALVVLDRMEIVERRFPWGRAAYVHRSLRRKEPSWADAGRDRHGVPESLPQPGRFDYAERLLDVVGKTADVILEIAPTAKLEDEIVLVEIPAWDRLVQPGFGPVLVSDRLWRLLPVKDGLFFHDLALVRSVAPTLLYNSVLTGESPRFRAVAADLLGVFFSGYYSKTVHRRLRSVEEIIGFARMFPTIDNLLYAPQIPFREVYFQFYEEPEPLRDEPWMYMNRLPRGKRVLAKLEERTGRTPIFDAVRKMATQGVSFEAAADRILRAAGSDPAEFWQTWLGAYPILNYELGEVRDTPLSDGRIRHDAEVFRHGEIVREKVAVRFTDKEGIYADILWDAAEPRTVLSWSSRAPIAQVEIDPKTRLVESPSLTPDHPLQDNSRPLPWRPPMFTTLVVWGDLTAKEPYAEIGFWLRRKYDNTNIFSLDLAYTPYTWGGTFSYLRFFGNKRTMNSRTWFLGPRVSAVRFGEVDASALHLSADIRQSAFMGSVGILAGRDTRTYAWDPMHGSSISAAAVFAAGGAHDGSFRRMGRFSIRMGRIFSPAVHHTIALYGGASAVLGNPVAANLTSLSDRLMLRGFDSDETFGRVGLYAVAEYRHTLIEAASLPAPLYSWFDRFQGALFVAGGTISKPSGALDGIFTKERLFSEVGYGLRVHLLFLGVHQYLMCLDFAYPLTPRDRYYESVRSDGTTELAPRIPYKIMFGITQTF